MQNSLIEKYLSADYIDTHKICVTREKPVSVRLFFDAAFSKTRGWTKWLLALRNVLVKPFGLDTNIRFSQMIIEQNADEIVVYKADKHLDFYVSISGGEQTGRTREFSITSIVRYHNALGRIYFFIIRPFHIVIVKSILKRTARYLQRESSVKLKI